MSNATITWPGYANQTAATEEATQEPQVVLAYPGEEEGIKAFGDEIFVHLGGAQTGGRFTAVTCITPPGSGPPPHVHNDEDEWFIPLEGRVEFFLDGQWQEMPLNTLIFIPRGTVHTFRNCGDEPLKMMIHTSPSGFEVFFARCAAEFAKPGPPDMGRIVEISAEHGIHYVTE